MGVTFVTSFPWSPEKLHLIASTGAISIPAAAYAHVCRPLPCRSVCDAQPYPVGHAAAPAFYWTTSSASVPSEPPTVIACSGVWVVSLAQRVGDGIWIANLDRHRHGPGGPFRWCTSYEQGRAGAEMWVTRHEVRLREDVAKVQAFREAVRANRLAKLHIKPPFGWEG